MSVVVAILTYEDEQDDIRIELPLVRGDPPVRVRLSSSIGDAMTFDVFVLADSSEWPESIRYRYTETVPRTTDEG